MNIKHISQLECYFVLMINKYLRRVLQVFYSNNLMCKQLKHINFYNGIYRYPVKLCASHYIVWQRSIRVASEPGISRFLQPLFLLCKIL